MTIGAYYDNMQDNPYYTAMQNSPHYHLARHQVDEFLEIVNKKSMDWRDENGRTPLHYAVFINSMPAVNHLISMGADLDAQEYMDEATAIMYAAKYGYFDMALKLAWAGANVQLVDNKQKTARDYAKEFVRTFIDEHLMETREPE